MEISSTINTIRWQQQASQHNAAAMAMLKTALATQEQSVMQLLASVPSVTSVSASVDPGSVVGRHIDVMA